MRHGLLVAACLTLAAVTVLPGWSVLPTDPLSAAVTASEQALVAAEGVVLGSPASLADLSARNAELRRAIESLDQEVLADPAVRSRIEIMLANQQAALIVLARGTPDAKVLLAGLQRVADSLDLHLPVWVPPVPPAVPAVPAVGDSSPPQAVPVEHQQPADPFEPEFLLPEESSVGAATGGLSDLSGG